MTKVKLKLLAKAGMIISYSQCWSMTVNCWERKAYSPRNGGGISDCHGKFHEQLRKPHIPFTNVIIHVHSIRVPKTPGRAIFDCFRFDENGKVVEHWDAIQDIPVKAANPKGML